MTKDEILIELESRFLITIAGESYFLTEKVLDSDEPVENSKPVKKPPEILNTEKDLSLWPDRVKNTAGRTKAVALMDLCEIPIYSIDRYRLRVLNDASIKYIEKLTLKSSIIPDTFITAVKRYYKTMRSPKNFKNFILDGDAQDVYEEYNKACSNPSKTFIDPSNISNETWG